jgi:hypothetical protein
MHVKIPQRIAPSALILWLALRDAASKMRLEENVARYHDRADKQKF